MIKQIQLRGISRTPSDRLSEDGGLSESLNMYMDTAENAPALVPTDVTTDLGLPEGLSAKRIFIHKAANYENYVVVLKDKVVAYTPDIKDDVEPLTVLELTDGEEVTDITSIGNTLVVSSSKNLHYCLYKGGVYVYLGNKVPFPYISFEVKRGSGKAVIFESRGTDLSETKAWMDSLPTEQAWNEDFDAGKDMHSDNNITELLSDVWSKIDEKRTEYLKQGLVTGGMVIRYSVKLYDGSELSSMPILLADGFKDAFDVRFDVKSKWYQNPGSGGATGGGSHNEVVVTARYNGYRIEAPIYQIYAKLESEIPSDWNDLIEGINIYVSDSPIAPICRTMSHITDREILEDDEWTTSARCTIHLGDNSDAEFIPRILQAEAITRLANHCSLSQPSVAKIEGSEWQGFNVSLNKLKEGSLLDVSRLSDDAFHVQSILANDDMKHYVQSSSRIDTYNNHLLFTSPSQIINYDYDRLNSQDIVKREQGDNIVSTSYEVTYFLRSNAEDKVTKRSFVYVNTDEEVKKIYAYQVFPDNRAYKMQVKQTTIRDVNGTSVNIVTYGEFEMQPHPYLDCAYYYGGIENELTSQCTLVSLSEVEENTVEGLDNKLLVSGQDNPFFFPLKSRYTFQSKVVGTAVASAALSQGQFGQFPLYVFTEDGIWAMETTADGSFVSQKPLSREVCINPDSITSIDNAVVFVTSKGVMMVQGSQVMNISPYMNGQHYVPNESAKSLIARQRGFGEYESSISDETPFTSFMRDAKVAYDYNGQRLVFISPDNKDFQYVYKIDTQTWHKVAFEGLDLVAPLNSYPECLIQGKEECIKLTLYVEEISNPGEQSFDMFVDEMTSVTSLTEEELRGMYYDGESCTIYVGDEQRARINKAMHSLWQHAGVSVQYDDDVSHVSRVYDFSTVLDTSTSQPTAKGILITRPFDLGMPDVFKSITNIKVRGYYDKSNVRFILQGSDNGRDFYTMNSLRGKSWKMFRLFILADLEPTERISWVDIDFEPRFNNKLR